VANSYAGSLHHEGALLSLSEGIRVQGSICRISGIGLRGKSTGLRIEGFGLQGKGSGVKGLRVKGLGLRV